MSFCLKTGETCFKDRVTQGQETDLRQSNIGNKTYLRQKDIKDIQLHELTLMLLVCSLCHSVYKKNLFFMSFCLKTGETCFKDRVTQGQETDLKTE